MQIQGSYLLPCSIERAWAALNDSAMLKTALKGCESLERVGEDKFTGTVATRIGPISARFSGTMVQSEVDAPRSCRMTFEGQGGVAGFAKGSALVTLAPEQDGTLLTYDATAQVGGKMAQLGSRLVEGTARSMADDFFGRFTAALSAEGEGEAIEPAHQPKPEIASSASRAKSPTLWLIVVGLAVAAVVAGSLLI